MTGSSTIIPFPSAPQPKATTAVQSCLPRSAVVANQSRAKATDGKAGMAGATGPVRRSSAGTGLRVGEASADLPTTSEIMDVTAGETAQIIQNAAQSLSDRSPAPASAAMPGSIEQAAEANQQGSHSSDVEQPHCRRTRADSSPAASTKFEYPDLPDFLKRGAA